MTLQEQCDEALFAFSQGDYAAAIAKLQAVLACDPAYFDAQLALGMSLCRQGDFAAAIVEGHKAEKLKPQEQLVHTNLSLFYLKAGDIGRAEYHSFQAKVAGWRADAQKAKAGGSSATPTREAELPMAGAKPQPVKLTGNSPPNQRQGKPVDS